MKMKVLEKVALHVVTNYSPFLTLQVAKDLFYLPLSDRVKLRHFIASNGLYYCDLAKYVYDDGRTEIYCTLCWLTRRYERSVVFLYNCKTRSISLFHNVSRLKLK